MSWKFIFWNRSGSSMAERPAFNPDRPQFDSESERIGDPSTITWSNQRELNVEVHLGLILAKQIESIKFPELGTQMNYKVKFLKVKIKSLAEESRIIRREEQKATRNNQLREELHLHRVKDVRDECRATHIAYAYLRGKPYRSIEKTPEWFWQSYLGLKIWERVQRMVAKYGDPPIYLSSTPRKDTAFDELKGKLEEWRKQ